jgi:type IV pilus assembly protein PilZ
MPETDAEKRDHPRTGIELKVTYKRLNTFFHDYTRNISKGGTFIRTPKPLEVGTEFLFKLLVPELMDPLTLKGRVQWVVSEEEAGQEGRHPEPGMGIQFLYETEEDKLMVESTVERLMKKHLGERAYAKLMGK